MGTLDRRWVVLALALGLGCRRDAPADNSLNAGGVRWRVVNGAWRIAATDTLEGNGGSVLAEGPFERATLDADFELIRGVGGRTVGFGFRMQPFTDTARNSGYGFNVTTGANTYNVFEGHAGNWQPVDPTHTAFQPSPALHAGRNHVTVVADGGHFTVNVNGTLVATFDDDTYARGGFSLWVESTAETVRFSNLHVTQ